MTSPFRRGYEHAQRNAWVVWLVGAGVYFLALFHRASLGVAGPAAVERLDLSATALGSFVMVQLGVYALMQVPAGLAVDRWGPRKVLIAATLTMGVAQVGFGFATSYALALGARTLLGVGDAMVFISVLRLAAGWFPARRYAVLTMATSVIGISGNLLATVPLVISLETIGWTRTFVITGLTSIGYVLLLLRPAVAAPYRAPTPPPHGRQRPEPFLTTLRATVSLQETRLGFWTHQATQVGGNVISLVWGYPFLTEGLGYSAATAAAQLSIYVVVTLGAALVVGPLAGRHRGWRMPMAVGIAVGGLLALLALVVWPGGIPPRPVVSVAFALLAFGVSGSQIGIHIARDYNPPSRVSTATGIVNSGGFVGAMISAVLVGVVLDARSGGATPTLTDYRWALSAIIAVIVVALLAMLFTLLSVRGAVLRRMAREESVVVPAHTRWWDLAYARMVRRDEGASVAGDPQAERGGSQPQEEHPDGVPDGGSTAVAAGEADGLEARRAEGGVPTEQAGAQDGPELAVAEEAGDEPQEEGAADVDDEHAERHHPADDSVHQPVDDEAQHRPEAAGDGDEDGDHRAPIR